MSFGIRNGSFTGVRRSDIIDGSQYAYLNARRIVNGNDRAELIQGYLKTPNTLLRRAGRRKRYGAPTNITIVNASDNVSGRKGIDAITR